MTNIFQLAAFIVLAWVAFVIIGFRVGRMFDRRAHARVGRVLIDRVL